jgi:hypothetical protein
METVTDPFVDAMDEKIELDLNQHPPYYTAKILKDQPKVLQFLIRQDRGTRYEYHSAPSSISVFHSGTPILVCTFSRNFKTTYSPSDSGVPTKFLLTTEQSDWEYPYIIGPHPENNIIDPRSALAVFQHNPSPDMLAAFYKHTTSKSVGDFLESHPERRSSFLHELNEYLKTSSDADFNCFCSQIGADVPTTVQAHDEPPAAAPLDDRPEAMPKNEKPLDEAPISDTQKKHPHTTWILRILLLIVVLLLAFFLRR